MLGRLRRILGAVIVASAPTCEGYLNMLAWGSF